VGHSWNNIKMNQVVPVILSGGVGSRLWPLSRAGFPKQFLALAGNASLFQQAVERVNRLACNDVAIGATLVVTNEDHRFLSLEQLREIKQDNVTLLLEPEGRNTAPALTLAALQAMKDGQDPILVVTPSDQIFQKAEAFETVVRQAIRAAASGALIVLGVTPDSPETGYGYVQQTGVAGEYGEYAVALFTEKPTLDIAKAYLAEGVHTWNSGLLVIKASVWIEFIRYFRPDIAELTSSAWALRSDDGQFVRPNKEVFLKIPSDSVDYAVLEKCPATNYPIRVIPLDAGWSDLGAWDSVFKVNQSDIQDADNNVVHGDVEVVDAANSLIYSTSRLIGVVGVNNLIIVETPDAVLVADRSHSQNVKKLTQQLNLGQRSEQDLHRKVHRPWGWFDCVDESVRFKVKRIQVKPGASLSLQKHHHRAEHWIVVKGTAEVRVGREIKLLTENQSVYIPLGEVHRLANPGIIPLEIIEVQTGGYLGEDDITRLEDDYGRLAS
jgi:mannose-1-phosphate guanylyltransferase/mannose-6-phosphate isomerase